MHPLHIPAVEGGLGLFEFLLLTGSFQLLGGFIAYFFLTKVKEQEKKIGFIAFVLMVIVAFYSFQFIAKTWETLLIFFGGLGTTYFLHAFLMRKANVSTGLGIVSMIGIHELIEGLFVAGTFLFDVRIGLVSGLIIALHELPEGMITGTPFFVDGAVKKGFLFILISLAVYVLAGTLLSFVALSKTTLFYVDAFTIGAIVALGIVELQMLRKPS